jgi:hypothetical protein
MTNPIDNCNLIEVRRRLDELVPTLELATREVAALLQQGNIRHGLSGLQEVLEALQSFHEGMDFLMSADRHTLSRRGLEDLRSRLEQTYPPVLAAIEANDMVTLADVLDYELAETFAEYGSRVY